jgi:asparagine synthase (glutamine-hydrolysing)
MSDVPLGAFLSGGLDSSSIVALMSEQSADPIDTFSIGFQSDRFDESDHARYVADHFGTNHRTVDIDLSSMDLFGDLVQHYGEPLADPAVLPTLALSRYTSQEVKVVLSGEGADELLGGYWYYDAIPRQRKLTDWLPDVTHQLARRASQHVPVGGKYLSYFGALETDETAMEGLLRGYELNVSSYVDADDVGSRLSEMVASTDAYSSEGRFYDRKLAFDLKYWLPDDLLYKVDHASMAHSLEARVPFLDHELVTFAYGIPSEYKRGGYKPLLQSAVGDIVPDRVLKREKHGLGVPISSWFRQDHEAIEKWLAEPRLDKTPYVRTDAVYDLWDRHRHERGDYGYTLWKVLNFVAWYHTIVRE